MTSDELRATVDALRGLTEEWPAELRSALRRLERRELEQVVVALLAREATARSIRDLEAAA